MGGWCRIRERCRHYSEPASMRDPAERLCDRGADGVRKQRFEVMLMPGEMGLSAAELRIARRICSE